MTFGKDSHSRLLKISATYACSSDILPLSFLKPISSDAMGLEQL